MKEIFWTSKVLENEEDFRLNASKSASKATEAITKMYLAASVANEAGLVYI